jgi:hypothetical protein
MENAEHRQVGRDLTNENCHARAKMGRKSEFDMSRFKHGFKVLAIVAVTAFAAISAPAQRFQDWYTADTSSAALEQLALGTLPGPFVAVAAMRHGHSPIKRIPVLACAQMAPFCLVRDSLHPGPTRPSRLGCCML